MEMDVYSEYGYIYKYVRNVCAVYLILLFCYSLCNLLQTNKSRPMFNINLSI